jgi:MFS transporter, AAHS family, 3-hydroxyphenylpropionic acid transporter
MKRTLCSKIVLIAVTAFAVCITLAPCKPAPGFGGASATFSGSTAAVQPTIAQAAKAEEAIPASIRNRGVGAAVAAGRLGTIAGPLLAGSLLRAGRTAADVLIVLIPITLVSGTMTLLVVKMFSKQKKPI